MSLIRRARNKASRTKLRVPLMWYRHRGLDLNDVFVASYPRSGNTWLRFLLYEALTSDTAEFEKVNRDVPDIGRQSKAKPILAGGGRLIKTHEPYRVEYRKAIYVIRDARDVALSEYAYEKAWGRISTSFDDFLKLFLCGKVNGYGPWHDHVNSWLGSPIKANGGLLVVSFSDMRKDVVSCVARIVDFLGVTLDRKEIQQVVANNSLDRIRAKEDRAPQIVRRPGKESSGEENRFIRSGNSGGWQTRLTEPQVAEIERVMGSALLLAGFPLAGQIAEKVGGRA